MIWNMFMFFDLFSVRKNEIVVGLDTGAPVGYLDLYPQVFSFQNSYPHLWKIFPTDHLDPWVKNLQVMGTTQVIS